MNKVEVICDDIVNRLNDITFVIDLRYPEPVNNHYLFNIYGKDFITDWDMDKAREIGKQLAGKLTDTYKVYNPRYIVHPTTFKGKFLARVAKLIEINE